MADPLERVIRPIVEGQLRGFLHEHPVIVDAVDWYKPRQDKATTLVNSISKRIVRDLTCPMSRARLAAALLASLTDEPSPSTVESCNCGEADRHGVLTVPVAPLCCHDVETVGGSGK